MKLLISSIVLNTRMLKVINLQIPLDIPDVEILKVEYSKTNDLIITVKSTKLFTCCRSSGPPGLILLYP